MSASPTLGNGGFSRLGLRAGKTEEDAARLIQEAMGLGINVIDTAPSYGMAGVLDAGGPGAATLPYAGSFFTK